MRAMALRRGVARAGTGSTQRNFVAETPARSTRSALIVAVIDRQAAERRPQRLERQAEIEQRAEHHVARRAREAVEVQRLANLRTFPSPDN